MKPVSDSPRLKEQTLEENSQVASFSASGARHSTLIIGWGCDLRCDDGVGQVVAQQLAKSPPSDTCVMPMHQLSPDLAYDIAQYNRIIFIDAYPAEEGACVRAKRLQRLSYSSKMTEPLGMVHSASPNDLCDLARTLYGKQSEAWVVAVPAFDFSIGESLSPGTQSAVNEAVDRVFEILKKPIDEVRLLANSK